MNAKLMAYLYPEYYHVRCFEKIADFTDYAYLARVSLVTRSTFLERGLTLSNASNYIVDAGAERLVLAWIVTRQRLIRQRDGMAPESELDPDFSDLLSKAGLAGFEPRRPSNMSDTEFMWLTSSLAPNEVDGPDDAEPWNLFRMYLDETPQSLNQRHGLYDMLHHWRVDKVSLTYHLNYQRL